MMQNKLKTVVRVMFFWGMIFSGSVHAVALKSTLDKLEKQGARFSVLISDLDGAGPPLFQYQSDRPLNPASSVKLFTAYSALLRLKPDYLYKTEFGFLSANQEQLCIKGYGDPSLVIEDLFVIAQDFSRKTDRRRLAGITLDSTAFDAEFFSEERADQESERAYNAPVSALNFNYNAFTVFVNGVGKVGSPARVSLDWEHPQVVVKSKVVIGKSTNVQWSKEGDEKKETVTLSGTVAKDDEWRKPFRLNDPGFALGHAFIKLLEQKGWSVPQKVNVERGKCEAEALHTHRAKPMSWIVQLMNKYSNNFIADSLVKTLDLEMNKKVGTNLGGIRLMIEDAKAISIDFIGGGRKLVSGSGLTRDNAIAAKDFVQLLQVAWTRGREWPEMITSLPLAGTDGTLRRKFLKSPITGVFRGKTGTLTGVQSLVGVLPTPSGRKIAVAFIANGSAIPENELESFLETLK